MCVCERESAPPRRIGSHRVVVVSRRSQGSPSGCREKGGRGARARGVAVTCGEPSHAESGRGQKGSMGALPTAARLRPLPPTRV
jgi:hypothetical protein